MNHWRWDQGRLEYFLFDNLRAIAVCLADLDGIEINPPSADPLRPVLESGTGLPFSPSHYRLWRNYARVFGCSLLATKAGKHLVVSDFCQKIADGTLANADDYLNLLIQRFRFPSPIFESYDPSEPVAYPFVALLKYLQSRAEKEPYPSVTIDEVFSCVIGNGCTGLETAGFYQNLRPTSHRAVGDQERQVREMLLVASQFSFLKWANKRLCLDASFDLKSLLAALSLSTAPPLADRTEEFIGQTKLTALPALLLLKQHTEMPTDFLFTEGKRTRATHLKIERSPLLRKIYFEKHPQVRCDMCALEPRKRYPWTDNLLDIHHLLPLASGVAVTLAGTSLADIVPLCPNCHRSVHAFYKNWLNARQATDFKNTAEARAVYGEAKQNVLI